MVKFFRELIVIASVFFLFSIELKAQSFTPDQISGLSLWLKADSGIILSAGTVSQWSDISGNNNNAVQNTDSSYRPSLIPSVPELNGYPAVHFDGVNDLLNGTTISGIGASSLSIFIITKGISTAQVNAKYLFAFGTLSSGYTLFQGSGDVLVVRNNTSNYTTPISIPNSGYPNTLIEIVKTVGSSVNFYKNASSVASNNTPSNTAPFTDGDYHMGDGNNGLFWKGEIAEVIVYQSALSNADRLSVENYLFAKYTPPVSLGPDTTQTYSLCPVGLDAENRFVNYNWSTGSSANAITANINGEYSVTTTDVFGKVSSDTINVTLLNPVLNHTDTTLCTGDSILLQSQLAGSGYSFLWSDGQTSAAIYALANTTPYSVTVTSSNDGCSNTTNTVLLSADTFAYTVSLGADTTLCSGATIGLNSPSSGLSNLNFNWSTGSTSVFASVTSSGTLSVTVTDTLGCVGMDSMIVSISGNAPVVAFTGDTFCMGMTYSPQNFSHSVDTSTIISYQWDFADGYTDTATSLMHLYGSAGIYSVSLTATTSAGCSNSLANTVQVKSNPQASFSGGTSCQHIDYQFYDFSIPPPGDSISMRNWDFGDGATSMQQNPIHAYSSTGNYNLQLIVTSSNGCLDTTSGNIQVVSTYSYPQPPLLTSPLNNTSSISSQVDFQWDPAVNASKYSLVVSTDSLFSNASVYSNIYNDHYPVILAGNQTYFWKVRSFNICNDSAESAVRKFSIFNPSNISSLSLWLRADSGITLTGGSISQWDDGSGNNNNAVQNSDPSFRPQLVAHVPELNDYPVVRFDGVDDFLSGSVLSGLDTSSISVFIISKGINTSMVNAKYLFAIGDLSHGFILYQGNANELIYRNDGNNLSTTIALPNAGYPHTLIEVIKVYFSTVGFYKNATPVYSNNTALYTRPFTTDAYHIGDGNGQFWNGEMAELIVYKSALTTTQRNAVENYLFNKYAPPVNLGSDIHQPYSLCPITLDASDRFVSYVWSTGETTPQIQARKSGTFWVQTTDVFNRVSADTIQVFIPYLGVSPRDTVVCLYSPLSIAPVLTSSPYTFEWNTLETSPSISVTSSGDYVCTISDTSACAFISDTIHVVIDSFALQSLLPADTTLCAGNPIMLDTAGHSITGISWSNGPTTPAVSFNTTGDYIATATDNHLCVNRDTIQINISWIAPNTNFTSTVVCFGDTTQLSDVSAPASPDNITTWNWDFGDGNSSSLPSPSHYYNSPGDYNVTLSIVTDSGCTGIKTKVVTSSVPPIPAFTYPNIICAGVPTTLLDNSIFLFGDSITNWIWTFNGTDTLSAKNPIYEFPGVGSYQVKLKAVSKSGCSDTITQKIDVFPSLVANFNAANVCIGDSTIFTDATSSYSVVSWQWDFGDLTFFSTKQNPKHKYSVPGSYNVSLRIENAIGCVDYESKNINIVTKPTATFGDLVTCVSDYYTPLDSSVVNNDTIATWNWTIAGANYTNQTPVHFFADTGLYAVHLKVTTLNGCTDSITKMVKVKPHPTALFSFAPLYGEAPVDIAFINQSRGASSYLWNFGDSETSTDEMPLHTYTQNGSYQIHLAAYSTEGCEDTASKIFVVKLTDLDLAVTEVSVIQAQQTDGSYLIGAKAKIANLGTRTITQAKFYITIGSGGIISEEWNGILYSGQIMDTIFGAQFVVAPENANSYICVEAVSVNHGETEIRVDNNSQCSAISQHIQLIGPSPNPVAGASYLGLILPKSGSVIIDIADLAGQYVVKGLSLNLPKGRSDYSLPVDKMRAAEYFIRVYYNDEKLTRKFVVGK